MEKSSGRSSVKTSAMRRSFRDRMKPAPQAEAEPVAPGRPARRPSQLALGLVVRRSAALRQQRHSYLAGGDPSDPHGDAPRWLGAGDLSEHAEDLAHRRRVVVDHVVDALAT